jgi:release factor glutamine methyltransferase
LSPRLDSELLLAASLGCKRIDLYLSYEKPLLAGERDEFKKLLRRRSEQEPVAYILGYKEFWGRRFIVNRDVLIPRPDSEILIEAALESKESYPKPIHILDIGTGSGCLAITLALEFADSKVTAWDVSERALEVAQKNARELGAKNIIFEHTNALSQENWSPEGGFDMIVCNPPYISLDEKTQLPPSVVEYEPAMALFAPMQGLAFYDVLSKNMRRILKPHGIVFLEIGASQAASVSEMMTREGWYEITVKQDYNRLDRMIKARVKAPS